MPLHGKIVVIKRSGGDGTEFPLTATCLFGRTPDCHIRIQLPQVSKEHCRIDLNENKEVILTNLSSVNPTRVNGEALQQSECLKHGDVITIIDRSFRFEYPPAPTPKKRSSEGRKKTDTLKVIHHQQVGDSVTTDAAENRVSEVSTDPLKDGTNQENIPRSLERTVESESKEDDSLLESKTTSPFNDLYQMIKKSLDVKTPRKSCPSVLQTPASKFCTPKPASVRKNDGKPVTPKKDDSQVAAAADEARMKVVDENESKGTPKSAKKQRRSSLVPAAEMAKVVAENAAESEAASPGKRVRTPPQRFTVGDVIEQICAEAPKSPKRRSKSTTPVKKDQVVPSPKRASPRNQNEKVADLPKKRKSGELPADLPKSQMKKKRVSFGGHLSPELFDKRLPPDSPLRKGAAPRRSLSLLKPQHSLLRRASVIGLLKFDKEKQSPKKASSKTASPKTPTPQKSKSSSPRAATPAKASPKSKSASPKAATPAKQSPKSSTLSPKASTPSKKSPKSRSPSPKAATPAKASPKSKSPSSNKFETPKSTKQTPTVQGRFSVSRISTPSPVAEESLKNDISSGAVTPKIPLGRKSISRKTPRVTKSAVKVMLRRSGISRASMKAKSSWADIVKLGQPKTQVVAPTKKTVIRQTKKKAVPKPQTPAKALLSHVSTGHACSPVTIVVSRAQQKRLVQPTGAAPRLVTNVAVLKKNMKMDEDLTGVSEMFKTPVNEKKRKSVTSAMKTPAGLATPVVEPSVLSTPEEPGEMMVSPLSVSSIVRNQKYNSEAVQRLLDGEEESSFINDIPASETQNEDASEPQAADSKTTSVSTPKQKPEIPECLTGVKRIMKTPKQKVEPVEDLRGKLLKTPKQKMEQQECLSGVKRIMKTPRQKSEPVEDLRGKILKTPKQKPTEQECLTGVKRIMKTPKQKPEPIEDLRGRLLKTPKQKLEEQECLSGVKKLMETPKKELEQQECLTGEKMIMETPKQKTEPVEDIRGKILMTPVQKPEQLECLTGVKRIMETPQLEAKPVEDLKVEPLGMLKAPDASEATLEGAEKIVTPAEGCELMEEPLTDATTQETNEVEDQTPVDPDVVCGVAKELDFVQEQPQDNVTTELIDDAPEVDMDKEADAKVAIEDNTNEVPADETISEAAVVEAVPVEQPKLETEDEILSGEQNEQETTTSDLTEMKPITVAAEPQIPVTVGEPEAEEVTCDVTETETTASAPNVEKKPVRGRRATTVETKADEDVQEETKQPEEEPVVPAPVRGRRGKKTEAAAAPASVRQATRGRSTKTAENDTVEKSESLPPKVAVKPKRGRNAKKASALAEEVATETMMAPETEIEPIQTVEVDQEANDSAAPVEQVVKPKRGRKAKQPEQAAPEQKDAPSADADVSQTDVEKAEAAELCSEQLNVEATENKDNPSDAIEAVPQQPATESSPEVEAETCTVPETDAAVIQKKPVRGRRAKAVEEKLVEEKQEVTNEREEPMIKAQVRGRRAKAVESKPAEEKQEVEEQPEEPVIKAPVRGRRAKAVESKPAEEKQEVTVEPEETVVAAPVRGRRGKKAEAAAPAAPRQATRGRHAQSQENASEDQPEVVSEKAEEAAEVAELSTEDVSDQTDSVNAGQEEKVQEAAVKPVRGRRAKQAPVEQPEPEPETTNAESVELPTEEAQPQKAGPAVGKPRRGRKAKLDAPEQNEEVEETSVTMESKQPPVRAKRGRQTKQEEEKPEDYVEPETIKSPEPVKKGRRPRKAEQNQEEPNEEVQVVEAALPVEVEASVEGEPVALKEEATVSAKPRRGRKAKQDTETETTEVHEVTVVETTDKPKRGRRGKQVTEETADAGVEQEQKPEKEPEPEEKNNVEADTPVIKPTRGRGKKTAAKEEVSQDAPAKRARRGAAPPVEETTETSAQVSESAAAEPTKRGRRAAAKTTTNDAKVENEQVASTEEISSAAVEDAKVSKRSVKWKPELEVIDIPKETPVKAVRGRKSKLADESDAPSKAEEKDLSDTAVKAPPAKRGRRGVKVADVPADEAESKTQPQTRRGRSAKK